MTILHAYTHIPQDHDQQYPVNNSGGLGVGCLTSFIFKCLVLGELLDALLQFLYICLACKMVSMVEFCNHALWKWPALHKTSTPLHLKKTAPLYTSEFLVMSKHSVICIHHA